MTAAFDLELIAACREYTLRLDLERFPIIEELGKGDADNFDVLGPLGWAAVYYARCGIPVFPLVPGRKIPHKDSAGVKDATTETRRIRRWWRRHPKDNIGLATGHQFDVLDVDAKDGRPGAESLARLRVVGLTRGAWAAATTPSGGRHVLYAPSGDGNHADKASGLDFRGLGGYIVAPPSHTIEVRKPSGEIDQYEGTYQWEFSDPDARGRPFDWQAAMEYLYGPPPKPEHRADVPSGDLAGLVGFVAGAEEGERNNSLYWAACRAHEQGLPTEDLLAAAVARGLSASYAAGTIASASRAPQRRPA